MPILNFMSVEETFRKEKPSKKSTQKKDVIKSSQKLPPNVVESKMFLKVKYTLPTIVVY